MTKEYKPGLWDHMYSGLAPADVYPIGPPFSSLCYSWSHGLWRHFEEKPQTVDELRGCTEKLDAEIESIEKEKPMAKEEIEKKIAELQGKLEEMKPKPVIVNNVQSEGVSVHISVEDEVGSECIFLAIESDRNEITSCLALLETKSIIQALQKCADWLEPK